MDWSFASKPGAAPALMSFRSAAREEPSFPQFSSSLDGAKNPAPRILTHQVCAAALLGSDSFQLPSALLSIHLVPFSGL